MVETWNLDVADEQDQFLTPKSAKMISGDIFDSEKICFFECLQLFFLERLVLCLSPKNLTHSPTTKHTRLKTEGD